MNRTFGYSMLFILAFLLFANPVFGFGVVPAERDVFYAGGKDIHVRMKLMNPAGGEFDILLRAEGDTAQYIRFSDPLVSFAKGEKEKIITYTLKFPPNMANKGEITGKVTAIQIPKKVSAGDAVVSASVAVSQTVRLMVPITGKYARIRISPGVLEIGKEGFFNVEIQNLGDEDLISINPIITIYGPLNNKVAVIPGDELTLRSKETKKFPILWTPALHAGRYRATLSVSDGEFSVSKDVAFSIGEPLLAVESIDVANFRLGGIAKLAIAISSNWNLPIDEAYAKVRIEDASGTVYAEYKTAETFFDPFATQVVDAFWDTTQVLAGAYLLTVDLHYLKKTTEERFNITVEEDSITADTVLTGKVVASEGENSNMIRIILLFIGVQTLFLVGFVIYRTKKRKNAM
ncbi:MAG: hypothetical protein GXP63_05610 [DPANN group archaeon]|nr:hypothetical protein [DPANN group archaeon]